MQAGHALEAPLEHHRLEFLARLVVILYPPAEQSLGDAAEEDVRAGETLEQPSVALQREIEGRGSRRVAVADPVESALLPVDRGRGGWNPSDRAAE